MSRLAERPSSSQEELCCAQFRIRGLPYPQAHKLCAFLCECEDCFIVGIVSPIVRAAACGQVARWVYILCLLYSANGGGEASDNGNQGD
jgi:hypothetical protein